MFEVIFCTCPDKNSATSIAHKLVKDKVAACVNIIPGIESVYTWQNKLETSQEYLLLIKTTKNAFIKLEAIIKKEHPYECPEIISLPIQQGSSTYLQWLKDNTIFEN